MSHELEDLRAAERSHQLELAKRRRTESALVLRLALKERDTRELQTQVRELRQALRPAHSQVSKLLLDPSVNAEIMKLREQVTCSLSCVATARAAARPCQWSRRTGRGDRLLVAGEGGGAETDECGARTGGEPVPVGLTRREKAHAKVQGAAGTAAQRGSFESACLAELPQPAPVRLPQLAPSTPRRTPLAVPWRRTQRRVPRMGRPRMSDGRTSVTSVTSVTGRE